MSRISWYAIVAGALVLAPSAAAAQHAHGTDHAASPPKHGAVSARAREQIAAVEQAVVAFKAPDAAAAASFQPTLGMLPTMGAHAVNQARLFDDVNLLEPDVLMFSTVGGEQRLVGVAYGFFGQVEDAPDLFDGAQDVWHGHPEFAPPGQSLVMLHVWFVSSPDGPFAGHNPWLPYWAAGVPLPADSLMTDSLSARRARRLALALGEVVEPLPVALAGMGMGGLDQIPGAEALRDSIRAVIPRLAGARGTSDATGWNRDADTAISAWERIRDAYLEAVPAGRDREDLAVFYRQMEAGGHDH